MAKIVQTAGSFTLDAGQGATGGRITEYEVGSASGALGSVIHGHRIELRLSCQNGENVTLVMGAADALQLAEEIRAAVQRRDDLRQ